MRLVSLDRPSARRARPWARAGVLLAFFYIAVGPGAASAQQEPAPESAPIVERVNILQNQFLQTETLLYYVSTKPGERYDELRLREDFRRLWDTGFLEDLLLDVKDGPRGKVVSFVVRERRRIQIVDYRGSKVLTTTNIEDKLKEKDAQLRIDTFYDASRARRIEEIIKAELVDKGRRFGSVKHDAKNLGAAGVQVSFIIDDGPKARIKHVEFEGNQVFSDRRLRRPMKKLKRAGFWNLSWLGGKTTFTDEKWEEDQKNLRDFYLNHGYVTAEVSQPKVTYSDGKSGFFKKKPVKWITLEIPVTEGDQYRVGEMKFEGLTVFKEEGIRPLFKLKTGDVYRESRLKKGFDKLRDIYGTQGYFQWTGYPKRSPDPSRKIVDVTLAMEEDKRYYVGRIRFTGNDTTRDKVIRREIYMNEGEVFNTEALKMSIRRVNQLGYFKPMEGAPDFAQSAIGDDRLDVTFKVEEQNRNQFTFGGGVSGLEGTFINSSFSTSNFLGTGETITLGAQTGSRARNFQFAITEPYFLDRPITAGFEIFFRRLTYQSYGTTVGFGQQDQGMSLSSGIVVGPFSRVSTSYTYQIIDIYNVDQEALQALQSSATASGGIVPAVDPTYLGAVGRRHESGISPSWVRNTVDNPFQPRSGSRYTAAFQYVGGPLRGTVNYYRPTVEGVLYRPFGPKMALGVRGQVGYIRPFGDTTEIPYYQRYFLGGETQIRGYDLRTVAPYDRRTQTSIGGDKFLLFNAEYYLDLFGPARLLAFFDVGQAYPPGQGFYWKTMSSSTGLELRFLMPVLNVPFRLIYAWNPNRDFYQPAKAFKFAVGTTF